MNEPAGERREPLLAVVVLQISPGTGFQRRPFGALEEQSAPGKLTGHGVVKVSFEPCGEQGLIAIRAFTASQGIRSVSQMQGRKALVKIKLEKRVK